MNSRYRLSLLAVAVLAMVDSPVVRAETVTVTVTIVRVRQIDNVDDTRPGEFYARVRIGERSFPNTSHREDDGDVTPNWAFSYPSREEATVPIWINILDHDSPDSDDHCDASPVNGRKTLVLHYNPRLRQVTGDRDGGEGELIHAVGAGDSDRVEVWFRVTHSPAPPPPARGVNRDDLPRTSCGSCTVSRVDGQYERTTSVDIPCPRIESAVPTETYAGQWVRILGTAFGESPTRIGSCFKGPKRVMLIPVSDEPGRALPRPLELRVQEWSPDSLFAEVPLGLAPGRYRLGIFYPILPGSVLSSGLVSNMVDVTVLPRP